MGFHEVRFPTNISYGSSAGPGHDVSVIVTDSRQEERINRGGPAQRRYDAKYGIKNADQVYELQKFILCREGSTYGFRFRDWTDYSSGANGVGAIAFGDQPLGVGNGVQTQFQLTKTYSDTASTKVRVIRKPIHGEVIGGSTWNVLIGVDGSNVTSGWTVNTTTGIVTFTSAPSMGAVITAGFLFDVPCRFGIELNEGSMISLTSFEVQEIPSIPIVEELSPVVSPDSVHQGGAKTHDATANTISITALEGRVHVFSPSANANVNLPDFTSMSPGGPWFVIVNQSPSFTLTVRNSLLSTVFTLAAGSVGQLFLAIDGSGNKYWVAG